MYKRIHKIISFTIALVCLVVFSLPVYADNSIATVSTDEIYDYLASGLETGKLISEIETSVGNNFSLDPKDFSASSSSYSDEWIDDARAFVDEYLSSQSQRVERPNVYSSSSNGKAEAMSYATQCAVWSINKGRGNNFSDECVYMFVSHYIDIGSFYADASNSFLFDGPSRSEAAKYYCRWITDADRDAYDMYLGINTANSILSSVKDIYSGVKDIYGGLGDLQQAIDVADKTNQVLYATATTLTALDLELTECDVMSDTASISAIVKSKITNNEDARLSVLYEQFFEDDNIFRGTTADVKEQLIKTTLSMTGAVLLGCVTGGILPGVLAVVGSSFCDFGGSVITSEISAITWNQLYYGYHARMPLRMYDYYMD